MANTPPPTFPPAPNQSHVRRYKLAWRLLLISNLALGAYIFSRPRKRDVVKKERKGRAKAKIPYASPENLIKDAASEKANISAPTDESMKMPEIISENRWPKIFKW